ncbi:MAG: NADH-quinone oxidoreductase subunit M [Sphingobacteriaceae bacterium]|nr:MAG: NADH-quinone oxidoreductase subunit M [Sphingobacteriaceae bacterium]
MLIITNKNGFGSAEAYNLGLCEAPSQLGAMSHLNVQEKLTDLNLDGLSLLFLGLTVIITPIAILAAETRTEMISSLLAVEALLIGAFVTLDSISFYALFESTLIPMFFLIGATGSGSSLIRSSAATRFFLYTLGGSVLMLLALIGLYLDRGTTNWFSLVLSGMDTEMIAALPLNDAHAALASNDTTAGVTPSLESLLSFAFIFVAFAVKVPMIPVHLWLPEAHTIAPTPGSMILASLLLKLGGYGILRWLIPIFPEAFLYFQPFILTLSVISQIYACLSCLRQIDIKRIIAYSSIVHMNGCIFAIFSLSSLALKAAIFEMVSHGVISAALFFLIGCLYSRYKTRTLAYYRGLAMFMPLFSTFFFINILANSAVPLTSGFVGEFLMLAGTMTVLPVLTFIISISMIANAAYNIWLFNRLCFGESTSYITKFKDLTYKEFSILAVLAFYTIILGVYPKSVLYFLDTRMNECLHY